MWREHWGIDMTDNETQEGTTEEFLTALGLRLGSENGFDRDLAAVLQRYVLTPAPGESAVTQAKDAILKLASDRARSLTEKVGG